MSYTLSIPLDKTLLSQAIQTAQYNAGQLMPYIKGKDLRVDLLEFTSGKLSHDEQAEIEEIVSKVIAKSAPISFICSDDLVGEDALAVESKNAIETLQNDLVAALEKQKIVAKAVTPKISFLIAPAGWQYTEELDFSHNAYLSAGRDLFIANFAGQRVSNIETNVTTVQMMFSGHFINQPHAVGPKPMVASAAKHSDPNDSDSNSEEEFAQSKSKILKSKALSSDSETEDQADSSDDDFFDAIRSGILTGFHKATGAAKAAPAKTAKAGATRKRKLIV